MTRSANSNYQSTGTEFEIADSATDPFKKEDLQKLAKALDLHDHATNRGLAVARLGSGGATDTAIGNRTANQANAPSGNTGTLQNFVDWFSNRIKAITGTSNWFDAPAATLASLFAKFHDSTGHTHAGSGSNGPPIGTTGLAANAATQISSVTSSSGTQSTSSTSYQDLTDMARTITTVAGSAVKVEIDGDFESDSSQGDVFIGLQIDGGATTDVGAPESGSSGQRFVIHKHRVVTGLSAGSHTFKFRMHSSSGDTATSYGDRTMTVTEYRR